MGDYSTLFATLASVGGTVVAIVGGIAGTRHVELQSQLEGSRVAQQASEIRLSQAQDAVQRTRQETWPRLIEAVTSHDVFLDHLYGLVTSWRHHASNPDLRRLGVDELERLVRPKDEIVWSEPEQGELWEHLERIWGLAEGTMLDFQRNKVELTPDTSVESIWERPPAQQELACAHRPIRTYRIWRGLLVRAAKEHLFDDPPAQRTVRDIREELAPEYERHAARVESAMERQIEAERANTVTIATSPAVPRGLRTELIVLGLVALLGVLPSILYLTPGPRLTPVTPYEAGVVMALFTFAICVFLGHLACRLSQLRQAHVGSSLAHLRPPQEQRR